MRSRDQKRFQKAAIDSILLIGGSLLASFAIYYIIEHIKTW